MSKYGFLKIARDISAALPKPKPPTAQKIELPQGETERKILEFAKSELNEKTLNHSLRVYSYSVAIIKDQFPEWDLDLGVLFTTSLLHDIGTTEKNMRATKMSFEFYGGLIAREWVLEHTEDSEYADAVSEAVIRHQDLGTTGYITTLGLIIQISTILDNVGKNTQFIHEDTLDYLNRKYPRDGWKSCFAKVIDTENSEKPWGHTSALGVDDFKKGVLDNNFKYTKLWVGDGDRKSVV